MTSVTRLGQQLREVRECSGLCRQAVADLAGVNHQSIAAVEDGGGNWSSAVAYSRALGRRLAIHAPRDRKQTTEAIARTTGMSVNTVQKLMLLCASPDALDVDVHLSSLAAYLEVIGGSILVRK